MLSGVVVVHEQKIVMLAVACVCLEIAIERACLSASSPASVLLLRLEVFQLPWLGLKTR